MADEGYWRVRARRAPKPALPLAIQATVAVATVGLGLALAEWAPPLLGRLPETLFGGQAVTGIIFTAMVLGLIASLLGWVVLEGLAQLQRKASPEAWTFLLLAPAGALGALICAFMLPGPLDDKLTEARVSDSWGHYVDTVRFDETHLQQQLDMLELGRALESAKLGEPNHWTAVRAQVKLGRELIAKYRGYELYRRDEALKTVAEGNLRPAAQAKARKRILEGYAVLAPLFASRWDIIDAQIVQVEKAADLLQASPGGWRPVSGGIEFTNHGQFVALGRLQARSRDLEEQDRAVVCKLNKLLGMTLSDCMAMELIDQAQKLR